MVKLLAAVGMLLFSLPLPSVRSQETEPTARDWIRKLSDPDFRVREKAGEALWKLGAAVEPALRQAATSEDAEAAERAKEILARFDAGNYPDTPPEAVEQLRLLRSQYLPKQVAAFRVLVRLGPKAVSPLQSVLRQNMGRDLRRAFFSEALRILREEVPPLLVDGQDDRALALLALHTYGPVHDGMLDYVVELQHRGLLDAAEALLKNRVAGTEATDAARRTLVFVQRARGRHDLAIREAEVIEKTDPTFTTVVDSLLEDRRDWAKLAARAAPGANSYEGLKAYRLLSAGKTPEAKALLDRQVESENRDVQRNGSVDSATLALLMNDRVDDGLSRMKALRISPQILADILGAKMRYREALELLAANPEKGGAEDAFTAPLAAIRKARILHLLGDGERAGKIFDGILATPPGPDGFRNDVMTQLIRAEVRCGRFAEAAEHYGSLLAQGADWRSGQDGFELIFDEDADAARTLWRLFGLRGPNVKSSGATMTTIRRLLIGAATAEELRVADALAAAAPDDVAPLAVASVVSTIRLAAGRRDDAVRALTAAADNLPPPQAAAPLARMTSGTRTWVFGTDETFRFWMDLADLLHDGGDDRAALRYLDLGLLHHPGHPILLHLAARSNRKLGRVAEAERLRLAAHRAPLGNSRLRGRFLEELLKRGDHAEAKIEADLVLRSAWLMESLIGNVWNQVGRSAVLDKDFAAARFAYAKAIHYLLRTPGIAYVEGTGYFSVPMNLKIYEVRGLLAEGKIDAAVARAKSVVAESPASTDLVIALVPKLEALGRKADADALFQASWDGFRALLADHPRSAWAEAQAAWLAAGCRRELGVARTYALSAVEREPGIRFHRETLAEVEFRLGKREEAVKLMQALVREDHRNVAYRRQLDRYRNGDTASPLPETDD